MTVSEIMERVKGTDTGFIIAWIRDAFIKMALDGGTQKHVQYQNIIENRVLYPLPDDAVKIEKISVLYEEQATELITEDADKDFSDTNNWTNTDFTTFDSSGDLSVTNTSADLSCYLDVADLIEEGQRYKLEYDATIASGTFELQAYTDSTKLGDFKDGTDKVIVFTAPATDMIKIVGTATSGAADFDNFSLKVSARDVYKPARRVIGNLPETYFDEEI